MLLDQTFNRKYEVLEKVREGGMGSIYKVRHRLLDEIRIVKIVCGRADGSSEAFDRFLSEARAAIRLRHPNIAVLYDFALSGDGKAFIVMEFIEGWNLKEVLLGYGPPPLHLTLEIARQSLLALGYLHRRRIVHRDIAPDNLMLSRSEEGDLVLKLIDLGIAKNLAGSGALTATGLFLGKPRYGSPECLRGEGCDTRSDLYSFGVVLYELLTGHCPIVGHDAASHMAGHLFRPPLPFEETDPDGLVPRDLREIVFRALAKAPEERFQKAEDLAAALVEVQERFPPHRSVFEDVWRAFRPGPPRREIDTPRSQPAFSLDEPPPPLPGSRGSSAVAFRPVPDDEATPAEPRPRAVDLTQSLLTPLTRSRQTEEETRRTAAVLAALTSVPAIGPSTSDGSGSANASSAQGEPRRKSRSLASAEFDVTWARLPLRSASAAGGEVAGSTSVAIPLESGLADDLPGSRVWLAFVAASLLVTLAAGGLLWRSRGSEDGREIRKAGSGRSAVVQRALVSPTQETSPATGSQDARNAKPKSVPAPIPFAAAKLAPERRETPQRITPPAPPMQLGNMILASQQGVVGPEVRQLGSPLYPEAARGNRQSTVVRMRVLVDENGKVVDVRVVGSDPSGLGFDEAAMDAARHTTFFPPSRDGIPGKMWTDLDFDFRDSPSAAP